MNAFKYIAFSALLFKESTAQNLFPGGTLAPDGTLPPNPGFAPCEVCGTGMTVGNPDMIVSIPLIGDIACGLVEQAGLLGFIDVGFCPTVPLLLATCGCTAGTGSIAPNFAPEPAVPPTEAPVTTEPILPDLPTIFENGVGGSQFSTLALLHSLVNTTLLVGDIQESTFFLPDDDAFAAFSTILSERGIDEPGAYISDLATEPYSLQRACLLLSHVFPGSPIPVANFANQTITSVGETPAFLSTIMIDNTTVGTVDGIPISTPDVIVVEGIIHVLTDGVLPVPCVAQSLADQLAASTDHTILLSLVQQAGLVGFFANTRPITVFAPTDAAFEALDPTVLSFLANDTEALTQVLQYHVIQSSVPLGIDFNAEPFGGLETTLSGGELIVGFNFARDSTVQVDLLADPIAVVDTAIAQNGFAHIIETVLVPPGLALPLPVMNVTETPGNATEVPGNATEAPGNATEVPGNATEAPGNATEAPGNATDVPMVPPENATEVPIVSPPENVTEVPIVAPPENATEVPIVAPSENTTNVPAESPTDAPVPPPTDAPAPPPTDAPAPPPTDAPAPAPTDAPAGNATNPAGNATNAPAPASGAATASMLSLFLSCIVMGIFGLC